MTTVSRNMAPLLAALASGVLFAFSLPPYNIEILGWFALAPLLAASTRLARGLYVVGLGLVAGLTCGALHVGWHEDPSKLNYAYLPFVWIALLLGTVAALGAAVHRTVRKDRSSLVWVFFVACAGVAVEWLTTFTPLPVGVALCQHRTLPILQMASFTGIWGVSFLLWFSNAALADALLRRRLVTSPLVATVIFVGLVVAAGYRTLLQAGANASTLVAKVAAIQDYDGVDALGVGGEVLPEGAPDREALTREAARRGARLIVQSEGALGTGFTPDDPMDATNLLAQEIGSHLVVGYEELATPRSFNSAVLIDPHGNARGTHHKMYPFLGERLNIQAGTRASAYDAPPLGRIGLLICFDTCYTGPMRQCAAAGAGIVALPNYDPPTPRAVLHQLHGALMPFRAVENRVALVRSDPNGLSQIIDPWGRIRAEGAMYRAEALVSELPFGDGKGTFFTRWGDWFAYLCLIGTLLLPCVSLRRKEAIRPDNRTEPS